MLEGYGPVTQSLLGTLFTWGLTAAGAALVIIIRGNQRKFLDVSLGFATGVMSAASYWSLLTPAIEYANRSNIYGNFAFIPVSCGFLFGALFVYCADVFLDCIGIHTTNIMFDLAETKKPNISKVNNNFEKSERRPSDSQNQLSDITVDVNNLHSLGERNSSNNFEINQSLEENKIITEKSCVVVQNSEKVDSKIQLPKSLWKRIILLVTVITIHNIPEGLAVGVGFGGVGLIPTFTFQSARNLAIGIGIQNFPEGLAVSLPLHAAGFSVWKSFWYGQLSGMVEPIFGVLGAVAVSIIDPLLPYALSFAAGAMIYVVIDDLIPEANSSGNGRLATWGCIIGFVVMMCLEVGLN